MEESLFSKVANRVSTKTKDCKIFKKIACLGVAVGLAFNFSACNWFNKIIDKINPSTSSSLTSSDDDNYTGELCNICKGKHETSEHNQKADMSEYSEFVQVLARDSRYEIPKEEAQGLAKCRLYRGMPYGFLEDLGYDVEQIKKQVSANLTSRTPATETWAFFKQSEPNNLYMLVWIGDEATQICDNYYIRYKLTDSEKRDYEWLGSSLYKIKFCANDAISRLKKPEIISHTQQALSSKLGGPSLGRNFIASNTSYIRDDYSHVRAVATEFEIKDPETESGKKVCKYKGFVLNENYIFYVSSEDNVTYLSYMYDRNDIYGRICAPEIRTEEENAAMYKLKYEDLHLYTTFNELQGEKFRGFNKDYKNFIANVDAPFELENNK